MTDFFLILGPLPISGTAEYRNLKFGMWLDYVMYKRADDKLPPRGRRRDQGWWFWNYWIPPICRKGEARNLIILVCGCTTWGKACGQQITPPKQCLARVRGWFQHLAGVEATVRVGARSTFLVFVWNTTLKNRNYYILCSSVLHYVKNRIIITFQTN